jgi:hypothetical protein
MNFTPSNAPFESIVCGAQQPRQPFHSTVNAPLHVVPETSLGATSVHPSWCSRRLNDAHGVSQRGFPSLLMRLPESPQSWLQ